MGRLLALTGSGSAVLVRHSLRSCVTLLCLVVGLVPFLAGTGLTEGLVLQARESIAAGPDIWLSAVRAGRSVPFPVAMLDDLEQVDGIVEITPRIVAPLVLGRDRESAILVGIDSPESASLAVDGRLPSPGRSHELVVGSELATRLQLEPGAAIPPFYKSREGEHVSRVVGLFRDSAALWQSRVILTSLDTAAHMLDQPGHVTGALITCRAGYADRVARTLTRRSVDNSIDGLRLQTVTRGELEAALPRRLLHRGGVMDIPLLVLVGSLIPILMITSGIGLTVRRQEIGILKATGWQTEDILIRALVESVILAVTGASLAVVVTGIWLGVFNGAGLAGAFLMGTGSQAPFLVPYRLLALPVAFAYGLSLLVVSTGTVLSSWRAATAPPARILR